MQAIQTKYIAPTNTKPARIKATVQAGSVTLSWEYGLDVEENHKAACVALRERLGWVGQYYTDMVGGQLPDGTYAWVFLPKEKNQ